MMRIFQHFPYYFLQRPARRLHPQPPRRAAYRGHMKKRVRRRRPA